MSLRIYPAMLLVPAILFVSSCCCKAVELDRSNGDIVLVEAESFEDPGGWVVDQQFMDVMGSPFLLAHGLGEPVADAQTTVQFRKAGRYHVWVRTRDWVAPWKSPGAPGRFQIIVGGKAIEKLFGTEGEKWHWQDGGEVQISKKKVNIALHDLTGFEGRCDAILFGTDADFVPPNDGDRMAKFRRRVLGLSEQPEDAGKYDLVVVGGGVAGICASVSAARLGLQVALIQDRPVLGGNNSSEVRVWLNGEIKFEPYPKIGDIVAELEPKKRAHYGPDNVAEIYEDPKRETLVRAEKNIKLFLMHRANEVEVEGDRIKAVVAQNIRSGGRLRFEGRWFADCTGDGCIGYLAGADHDMTVKGHMGRSNLWNVVDTGKPSPFPRCKWAMDIEGKPFPGVGDNPGVYGKKGLAALGSWFWESGFFYDPIEKSEYIRDLNLRAMYGVWDRLKNSEKLYPNHKIKWAAYISGKRESRRIFGDIILTTNDLLTGRKYEDGCVPTSWDIDVHLPLASYVNDFGLDAVISYDYHTAYDRPYWIPYRCLYSRNIDNLFMAGRNISVSHEALGAVRVMRTTGMMGEIVGMAAAICKKQNTTPKGVYTNYLQNLKKLMSVKEK